MKSKYKPLCLMVFLLLGTSIHAQQNDITGRDTNPEEIFPSQASPFPDEAATGILTGIDDNSSIYKPELEEHNQSLFKNKF